jgi:serine/threonine-protein kinase RsbW
MVRFAHHDLRRWLERADLPLEVVNEVALACSDACANAVEHPQRATKQLVEIEAHRDESGLELRVRDYGAWSEQRRSAWRGRGLSMIDDLMDSVVVACHTGGTEIVMRRSSAGSRRDGETGGPPSRGSVALS